MTQKSGIEQNRTEQNWSSITNTIHNAKCRHLNVTKTIWLTAHNALVFVIKARQISPLMKSNVLAPMKSPLMEVKRPGTDEVTADGCQMLRCWWSVVTAVGSQNAPTLMKWSHRWWMSNVPVLMQSLLMKSNVLLLISLRVCYQCNQALMLFDYFWCSSCEWKNIKYNFDSFISVSKYSVQSPVIECEVSWPSETGFLFVIKITHNS